MLIDLGCGLAASTASFGGYGVSTESHIPNLMAWGACLEVQIEPDESQMYWQCSYCQIVNPPEAQFCGHKADVACGCGSPKGRSQRW